MSAFRRTDVYRRTGHAGSPADDAVASAYDRLYQGLMDDSRHRLAELTPDDADPSEVSVQIARVVDQPKG